MSVKQQSLFFQASAGIPPPAELFPLPLPIEKPVCTHLPVAAAACPPPIPPIMEKLEEINLKLDDILRRLKKK